MTAKRLLLPIAIVLLSSHTTAALDPSKSVDQYVHKSWTTADGLPQNTIHDIVQTQDGYLWLATIGGLVRFDGDKFKVFEVATDPELGTNRLQALFEDREGVLWIGSNSGHVVRRSHGVLTAFEHQDKLPKSAVESFHEDDRGTLHMMMAPAEVLWHPRHGEFEVRPRQPPYEPPSPALNDRDGNLWHARGTELHRVVPNAERAEFLDSGSSGLELNSEIRSLFEDREGNLWIGTLLDGLHRLHDGAFTSYRATHGFTDAGAVSITEAPDGAIWLGGTEGYFRFHAGRFRHVPLRAGFGQSGAVLVDRDGGIWLGAGDIRRLEKGQALTEDPIAVVYPREALPNTGKDVGSIRVLYEDRQGRIWIGFDGAGLGRLAAGDITVYDRQDGLVDEAIRCITEDRQGRLWIGTLGGMSRLDGDGFTNYTTADGLPNAAVRAIHEDEQGIFWIGTRGGGLARFSEGRVTTLYTRRNGMPENTVSRILADDAGNFWLSGLRGVTRVRQADLEDHAQGETVVATLYTEADGMSVSETNGGTQPAGWKASDGRLWFPMIRGAVVVDPKRLRPSAPPPLHIEQVLVDGQDYPFDRALAVPPGKTSLTVRYTALQFALPREVRFRYCLIGLDEEWIEGNNREAHYPHLPPGDYTFEIQAAAYAGGEWSKKQSFSFDLRPHFWQYRWFQAMLLVAFVAVLFQLRTRRIRARNFALQEDIAVRQRLAEDREQLLREMDANRVLTARLEALDRLAAEDEDGTLAHLAGGLARQERLYAEILRAESPAHLTALRDEIALLAEDAREAPDLHPDFLGELHRVLERLESLEHLPTGEDRAQVLGEALRRALAMQEERELSDTHTEVGGTPGLGDMALESIRRVFATALDEMYQRAELRLRLRSRKVNVRHEAVVVLEIENVGQGNAHDLRVTLAAAESALLVRRAEHRLKNLRRGQSARLEFLVEPRHSERVRLVFNVTYDDAERRGKELEFADLMELCQIPVPDTFRPLLPNPYVVGRPLLPADPFYGRTELFERLASSLQGAEQDNVVVLIGQRRMGKTSILRRLDRHLPASYVPVLVDLQGLLTSGEPAFFAELVAQIADELEERGVIVEEPSKEEFREDPGQVFRRRFLTDVRAALRGRRLLLVFDEMEVLEERIKAGQLTPHILPYLRSLMQHEENVSFMLAGTHRLDELTADYWGVLFNLAVYLDVGHLSEEDIASLFQEPTAGRLEIDPLALDKVYRTTGGHPHFSQLVAREMVELCNRRKISYVTIQDVNRVIEVVADKGQLHIAYLWDEADRDERLLLLVTKELLAHEGMASLTTVRRLLNARDVGFGDLPKALRRLRRKEILAEEAGQLHFRIDLLRRWLDRHQDLEPFVREMRP